MNAAADMAATFSNLPTVLAPGQSYTGLTLTCTNVGQSTATAATCVPSADVGTVSNVVCAPTPRKHRWTLAQHQSARSTTAHRPTRRAATWWLRQ